MATNKRDVEFILRAKNQASAAFDAVGKALEDLEKHQDGVAQSADKTGAVLNAFSKIAATVGTAYTKISTDADRAASAFQRQESALVETRAQYQSLANQAQAAQRVLARMNEFVGPRTKDEARQIALVERAYSDLTAQAAKFSASIEGQESNLRQSFYALQEIAGSADQAQAALQRVEQAQRESAAAADQAAAAQQREAAAIEKTAAAARRRSALDTRGAMAGVSNEAQSAWREAEEGIRRLRQEMAQTDQVTSEQEAQLARLLATARANKVAYNDLQVATEQYRRVLRDVDATQDQVNAAQREAEAALRGARAAMVAVAAAGQQSASANSRAAAAARQMADAHRQAAGGTDQLDRSMQSLFANSRRALSMYQRLRGQVLSLASSYIGLFGAIQGVNSVIQASMSMQAVDSRLNVVTGGDAQKTAQEIQWVRSEADRLGFSMQTLSSEWSKFAVAAQGSNFSMENARKIFTSVAEAGRVLKLDTDRIQSAMVALTQMMSKGTIQMEELRQQLGEHIPGAFALMAEAAGVSTAELAKMMEQGELTSDYLIKFADVLDRRFGSQLSKSLEMTQAELGRFQTAVFAGLNAIGEAGTLDAFTDAVRRLTEMLNSDDAQVWFDRIGKGIALVINALMGIIENLDLIAAAFAGLAAARGVAYLFQLHAAIMRVRAGLVATTASARALSIAMSAMGGPIGIAIGVAVTAVTLLASRISEADTAMARSEDTINDITQAYLKGADGAKKWQDSLKGLSTLQMERDLQHLRDAWKEALTEINQPFGRGFMTRVRASDSPLKPVFEDIHALVEAAKAGTLPIEEFKKRLDDIGKAHPQLQELVVTLQDQADEAGKAEEVLRKYEATMRLHAGTATEADKALLGVAEATDEVSDSQQRGVSAMEKYTEAMDAMRKMVPALKKQLEFDNSFSNINAQLQAAFDAIGASEAAGEIDAERADQLRNEAKEVARRATEELYRGLEDGILDALPTDSRAIQERIIQIESGGNPNAKATTSSATGLAQFTSGTWLGLFDRVFPELAGMAKEAKLALRTNAEASRKMLDVLTRQNQAALVNAGIAPNAANTYLAHFLGSSGAIKVLVANPDEIAANVLSPDQVAANQSILGGGRTVQDVINWATQKMGGGAPLQSSGWTQGELDGAKQLQQYQQVTAELQKQIELVGKAELQKRIINELDKAGVTAESEKGRLITEQVTKLYEAEQAAKAHLTAEERVNNLMALRKELQEQITFNQEQGNTSAIPALEEQLINVNARLAEAIQKAKEMWMAFGGPESELALARLNGIDTSVTSITQKTLTVKDVADAFTSNAIKGFDSAAQAIAGFIDGTLSGKQALEGIRDAFLQFAADFLRQIAQMILQQIIFNMVSGFLGGLGGGAAGGGGAVQIIGAGLRLHSGGVVGGGGGDVVAFNPGLFSNAVRYHTGGIAGLAPNEVPAILEEGEEVLTESDPRHVANGGAAGKAQPVNVKVVNTFDAESVLSEALSGRDGEQTLLNFVRANAGAVRSALGV